MYSNLSAPTKEPLIDYSIQLPFSEYIAHSRAIINEHRPDLQKVAVNSKAILDANSPFELYPASPLYGSSRLKYGVLLIHGLLDSPFTLRDIGERLQTNGILCRAVLLPGHGTTPNDLLSVSYQDWIKAVRYGIETLKKEVDQIFLVGYSTGAALSVFHALNERKIAGIILLAPAIQIKAPVDIVVGWHSLTRLFTENKHWLYREEEIDYTKYLSIPFNAVTQVGLLTRHVRELHQTHALSCPIFMAVSHEDETISSHRAIDFFSSLKNPNSKLLLYTSYNHAYPDPRILTQKASIPNLRIRHFSHVSIPFSPNNHHYGQNGDYTYASHTHTNGTIFGAYNRLEVNAYEFLHKLKLIKNKRQELTYNPDFDFMADKIVQFIVNNEASMT